MANTIVTPTWMGRETLDVADNETRFVRNITKKLADDFQVGGVKIGATVGVRLPQRFQTVKGQAFQAQALNNQVVYVSITDQAQIGWAFSSFQGTLEVQDAMENYVTPAGTQMANTWDKDGLGRLYRDISQAQGTPGAVPTANTTYFAAADDLTNSAVPKDSRNMVVNALMGTAIANANLALFGPRAKIDGAFEDGQLAGDALKWKQWWEDVNTFPHVYGTYSGTPTVNGAGQTGASLITQAWGSGVSALNAGDVFTIGAGTTGCYSVNPQSYQSNTTLKKFTCAANVSDSSGAMTITLTEPIVTSGPLQNVVAAPANSATINVLGTTGVTSMQGIGFHKQAFVMASAPPIMPNNGKARVIKKNGIAMRVWEFSDGGNDQHGTRLDSFYGFKTLRADWAVRIQS